MTYPKSATKSAIKEKRGRGGEDAANGSKGQTPEKSALSKRKREQKANQKRSIVWLSMQENPSNPAMRTIACSDGIAMAGDEVDDDLDE